MKVTTQQFREIFTEGFYSPSWEGGRAPSPPMSLYLSSETLEAIRPLFVIDIQGEPTLVIKPNEVSLIIDEAIPFLELREFPDEEGYELTGEDWRLKTLLSHSTDLGKIRADQVSSLIKELDNPLVKLHIHPRDFVTLKLGSKDLEYYSSDVTLSTQIGCSIAGVDINMSEKIEKGKSIIETSSVEKSYKLEIT